MPPFKLAARFPPTSAILALLSSPSDIFRPSYDQSSGYSCKVPSTPKLVRSQTQCLGLCLTLLQLRFPAFQFWSVLMTFHRNTIIFMDLHTRRITLGATSVMIKLVFRLSSFELHRFELCGPRLGSFGRHPWDNLDSVACSPSCVHLVAAVPPITESTHILRDFHALHLSLAVSCLCSFILPYMPGRNVLLPSRALGSCLTG